jgi:hypothetical protein
MQGFEKNEFCTEKRKELSCDLHSTILLYRSDVLFRSMEHVQEGFFAMLGRSDPYPRRTSSFRRCARIVMIRT